LRRAQRQGAIAYHWDSLIARFIKKGTNMENNNWLQQLVMLGVGTTSLVAEKLREASDELVKDGKLNPDQAKVFVDDMMQKLKSEQGNWETQMQKQVKNVMQEIKDCC
jgi:polyhydroxyalkanoate synthesis regulator phasin